jgi:hypothetical protein
MDSLAVFHIVSVTKLVNLPFVRKFGRFVPQVWPSFWALCGGAECFCYAPSVWRVWIASMVASVYAPVCEARLNTEIAW